MHVILNAPPRDVYFNHVTATVVCRTCGLAFIAVRLPGGRRGPRGGWRPPETYWQRSPRCFCARAPEPCEATASPEVLTDDFAELRAWCVAQYVETNL
jgi:hypothetical protein